MGGLDHQQDISSSLCRLLPGSCAKEEGGRGGAEREGEGRQGQMCDGPAQVSFVLFELQHPTTE